jgi:hypothetical protein
MSGIMICMCIILFSRMNNFANKFCVDTFTFDTFIQFIVQRNGARYLLARYERWCTIEMDADC